MNLRVAGFQMAVGQDIQENTGKIQAAIDWAAEMQADILLTPEGSLSGYSHEFDQAKVELALNTLTSQAREKKLGLALGTCFFEEDGKCFNQIRFYRPDGEYLGFHSKTLRCATVVEPIVGELNHYSASPLRTILWNEQLVIGGLICNDLWANPECTPMADTHLLQQLSGMGARIVFHAVNGGRDGSEWSRMAWNFHEANLRMRARAAKIWLVTVDNADPEHLPCSAPSGVIDPSGNFVCRVEDRGSQLFAYTIDLSR
jgi:predicted amidohydrolase